MIHDNCAICRQEPDVAFVSSISTDVIYLPEKKGNCISLLLLLCALAGRALASESSHPEQIANVHCVTCNFIFFFHNNCKHENRFNFALDVAFVFSGCFPFHIENFFASYTRQISQCSTSRILRLSHYWLPERFLTRKKLQLHKRLFRWQWKVLLLISCHCSITGKRISQAQLFFSFTENQIKKEKIRATKIPSDSSLYDTKPVRMFLSRSHSRHSPLEENSKKEGSDQ